LGNQRNYHFATMPLHPKSDQDFSRSPRIDLRTFFIPARQTGRRLDTDIVENTRVWALIPAYKPTRFTLQLVERMLLWNSAISVCVVDDCTPEECVESISVLKEIRALSPERVVVLRTPTNRLKAGALNFGLAHVFSERGREPEVVITLDDDVAIAPTTVRNLVTELLKYDNVGAACSQCHVLNKNANLLTRLQSLEYLGFNATRLADQGFFRGPLVMHGMLTAFRASALKEVGGFAEKHLIEDYEITARLKEKGWSVMSAPNAHAWTIVPERFTTLWRQRARWSYGGITVVDSIRYLPAVAQDLIGHATFWATLCAIDLLLLRSVFSEGGGVSPLIAYLIIGLSLLQFAIWYVFQLWLMRVYREKDAYDWMLRASAVPEFLYTNVLTLVLVGSYLFLFFKILTRRTAKAGSVLGRHVVRAGESVFYACGYTESWGTRS
jgi:cellulose synthase/poly-beta-1,6-N-acetylglucosamine synthase-like glycosyltransferase